MLRKEEVDTLRAVPFLAALLPYEVERFRMTVGDGFGELALLHQLPRTATVRSLEESRLLRLSAEDFLNPVLPNDAGTRVAHSIAASRREADQRGEAHTRTGLLPAHLPPSLLR